MAEWLGRGLQNLVQRFESASDLQNPFYTVVWRGFTFLRLMGLLGVEVSELFKPASTQKVVSGYLECDGRIVKVDSLDAVKRFIAEVEALSDNAAE